ncbi:MAG TPA: hypothetical protein DCM26_02845 [Desulfotomaculum sp.]|nr:hypothetical protein [Desulfotomaculum sp.]
MRIAGDIAGFVRLGVGVTVCYISCAAARYVSHNRAGWRDVNVTGVTTEDVDLCDHLERSNSEA